MMKKEDFITSVLNSTNGMTQVVPKEDLYLNIQHEISRSEEVSTTTLWMVAASIILLITLNLLLMNNFSEPQPSEMSSLEQSLSPTNQLYREL